MRKIGEKCGWHSMRGNEISTGRWKERTGSAEGGGQICSPLVRIDEHVVRVASAWCCMKADLTENSTSDMTQASIFKWPVTVFSGSVLDVYPCSWCRHFVQFLSEGVSGMEGSFASG